MAKTPDNIPELHPVIQGDWPAPLVVLAASVGQLFRNILPALIYWAASYLVVLVHRHVWEFDMEEQGISSWWYKLLLPYLALTVVFALALPRYALALADRKKLSVAEFLKFPRRRYLNTLATDLIFIVLILLPLPLLLIPAMRDNIMAAFLLWLGYIMWLTSRFGLATYAAADKNIIPEKAFGYSYELTRHHQSLIWGALIVLLIFGFLIGLAAAVLDSVIPGNLRIASEFISLIMGLAGGGMFAMLYRWLQVNAGNVK